MSRSREEGENVACAVVLEDFRDHLDTAVHNAEVLELFVALDCFDRPVDQLDGIHTAGDLDDQGTTEGFGKGLCIDGG